MGEFSKVNKKNQDSLAMMMFLS